MRYENYLQIRQQIKKMRRRTPVGYGSGLDKKPSVGGKRRVVRTAAGAAKYGVPIGSIIGGGKAPEIPGKKPGMKTMEHRGPKLGEKVPKPKTMPHKKGFGDPEPEYKPMVGRPGKSSGVPKRELPKGWTFEDKGSEGVVYDDKGNRAGSIRRSKRLDGSEYFTAYPANSSYGNRRSTRSLSLALKHYADSQDGNASAALVERGRQKRAARSASPKGRKAPVFTQKAKDAAKKKAAATGRAQPVKRSDEDRRKAMGKEREKQLASYMAPDDWRSKPNPLAGKPSTSYYNGAGKLMGTVSQESDGKWRASIGNNGRPQKFNSPGAAQGYIVEQQTNVNPYGYGDHESDPPRARAAAKKAHALAQKQKAKPRPGKKKAAPKSSGSKPKAGGKSPFSEKQRAQLKPKTYVNLKTGKRESGWVHPRTKMVYSDHYVETGEWGGGLHDPGEPKWSSSRKGVRVY